MDLWKDCRLALTGANFHTNLYSQTFAVNVRLTSTGILTFSTILEGRFDILYHTVV